MGPPLWNVWKSEKADRCGHRPLRVQRKDDGGGKPRPTGCREVGEGERAAEPRRRAATTGSCRSQTKRKEFRGNHGFSLIRLWVLSPYSESTSPKAGQKSRFHPVPDPRRRRGEDPHPALCATFPQGKALTHPTGCMEVEEAGRCGHRPLQML